MTPLKDYPLAALKDVRERERDEARAALARAVANVSAARDHVDSARRKIAESTARVTDAATRERSRLESGFDLTMVGRARDYERAMEAEIEGLKAELNSARVAFHEAQCAEKSARDQLATAEQEFRVVEKHRESWKAEQLAIRRRKESNEMDEIALSRWNKDQQ